MRPLSHIPRQVIMVSDRVESYLWLLLIETSGWMEYVFLPFPPSVHSFSHLSVFFILMSDFITDFDFGTMMLVLSSSIWFPGNPT